LWLLILPTNLLIAKFSDFATVAANVFFMYNCFRVSASYKAMKGSVMLDKAVTGVAKSYSDAAGTVTVDPKDVEIEFIPDMELEEMLKNESRVVSADLKEKGIEWSVREDLRDDLHDDVLLQIEKNMRLHELSRTYRRARIEMWLFKEESVYKKEQVE
jgi:hypothetical protein